MQLVLEVHCQILVDKPPKNNGCNYKILFFLKQINQITYKMLLIYHYRFCNIVRYIYQYHAIQYYTRIFNFIIFHFKVHRSSVVMFTSIISNTLSGSRLPDPSFFRHRTEPSDVTPIVSLKMPGDMYKIAMHSWSQNTNLNGAKM